MQSNAPQHLPKREAIGFLIVATLMVALLQSLFFQMPKPELDAFRYIDYALNIHDHGVFGLSGARRETAPAPANTNSPLYPTVVAFAIWLDPEFGTSLTCAIANRDRDATACPADFGVIVLLQDALVVGALFCLWATAMLLFRRSLIAWLAAALALASTKPLFYANHILTENLILFFFALMMLGLVKAFKFGRRGWWPVLGVILGLLTLTRPEYLYLALAFSLIGLAVAAARGWQRTGVALTLFVLAFLTVIGPWLARNQYHFGRATVTGGYGDVIIAYRSAYNRMSFAEWSAAFVYWLPGHGETLAAKIFPAQSYARLGTDPDSYLYRDGVAIFEEGLAAVDGDRNRLTGYLIRNEILAHPFRHAFASIPLAWRGVLAGKYLAVSGVLCLAILLIWAWRSGEWLLPVLVLPAAIMIALYAAISVSVPRYNVYLVYYYAIATAWVLVSVLERRAIRSA